MSQTEQNRYCKQWLAMRLACCSQLVVDDGSQHVTMSEDCLHVQGVWVLVLIVHYELNHYDYQLLSSNAVLCGHHDDL